MSDEAIIRAGLLQAHHSNVTLTKAWYAARRERDFWRALYISDVAPSAEELAALDLEAQKPKVGE